MDSNQLWSTLQTLQELTKIVWDWRDENEHRFPTPDRLNCARFVATEAGEVLDAYMKAFPEFSRNNPDKERDMVMEAGDLLFMLVTLIGPSWVYDTRRLRTLSPIPTPDNLFVMSGEVLRLAREYHVTGIVRYTTPQISWPSRKWDEYLDQAHTTIVATINFIELNTDTPVDRVVEMRLERIEKRLDMEAFSGVDR